MYPGWTFDTVDDMSFEQIDQALARGKKAVFPVGSDEQARAIHRDWRAYYGV